MRNKKNILCVVAHPDDEALGPGGTLIKHVSDGDKVYIIILSEGEDSKINLKDKNSERLFNAKNWSKTAGTNLYKIFNFPDQKLDNIPQLEIVKKLEKSIEKVKPGDIAKVAPKVIATEQGSIGVCRLAAPFLAVEPTSAEAEN